MQVGAELPKVVGEAGPQGLACLGASAAAVATATDRLTVSLNAGSLVVDRLSVTETAQRGPSNLGDG